MGEAKRRREADQALARGWPENLTRLHRGEEALRRKAITIVKADKDLILHVQLIEAAMNLIDFFARSFAHRNEDDLIVQHLGIRLFNASASSLKLALAGYGQASAAIQRDILETVFLLTLFSKFPERIREWANADHDARRAKFKPVDIRKEIDRHDGFTGGAARKHIESYAMWPRIRPSRDLLCLDPTGPTHIMAPLSIPNCSRV